MLSGLFYEREKIMAFESFIGEISVVAFKWVPKGWLKCEGQTLNVNQYAALFTLIGTTYGGDGINNFKLPDLRGVFPIGNGEYPNEVTSKISATKTNFIMGEKGGFQNISLTTNQLPPHVHGLTEQIITAKASLNMKASKDIADSSDPENAYIALIQNPDGLSFANTFTNKDSNLVNMKKAEVDIAAKLASGNTASVGMGGAVNILNPYLVLNFIICVEGVYPNRD